MSSGSDSRFQIGRRDFLVLSSTAALGVAASGFGSELVRSFGAPRPFSVGFIDGSHRLVSAERLHHDFRGDVARIEVSGFWSGDNIPRSTAIAAYFRDGGDVPFLAWGHVHRANARAPRSSFRVPVRDGALALGFESRDPLTIEKADALIAAANDREAAARCALKARRGTYVVAFDAKPNWSALQLGTGDKPLGNVSFDYLVFKVDHA